MKLLNSQQCLLFVMIYSINTFLLPGCDGDSDDFYHCLQLCIKEVGYGFKKKRKISHRQHGGFGALSRRGLNPIKLAYNPRWPDRRL